jgi:hypothetical protein
MYQHCVGVLLKRDTDLASKEVWVGGWVGGCLGVAGWSGGMIA